MGDVLGRIGLFEGLEEAERDELRALARPFAIPEGELLFRQGDAPSGLFLVGEGMLEIASRVPGDDAAAVSRIAPGEVVGEFALLDEGLRSANVRALADSTGLHIPARGFAAMVADGRAGALAAIDRLRALVATRTRATLERIASSSTVAPSELRRAAAPGARRAASPTPDKLRALVPFAALDDAACDEFFAIAECVEIDRGTTLIAAGDAADSAWFVFRGAVRVAIERGAMREQVAVHGPGEWAGLVAMIDGGVQPLAAEAAETSVLLGVARATFERWRREPGRAGQVLMDEAGRQLVRDQRRANRHLGRAIALDRFNAAARGPGVIA